MREDKIEYYPNGVKKHVVAFRDNSGKKHEQYYYDEHGIYSTSRWYNTKGKISCKIYFIGYNPFQNKLNWGNYIKKL
jgi:hypothetical protein